MRGNFYQRSRRISWNAKRYHHWNERPNYSRYWRKVHQKGSEVSWRVTFV